MGYWVVRLISSVTDYEAVLAATAAGAPLHVERWYHLGLQYMSPFDPTFWEVDPVEDPGEVEPQPRRRYVQGTAIFLRIHRAMMPFAKSSRISGQWFRLEGMTGQLGASPLALSLSSKRFAARSHRLSGRGGSARARRNHRRQVRQVQISAAQMMRLLMVKMMIQALLFLAQKLPKKIRLNSLH